MHYTQDLKQLILEDRSAIEIEKYALNKGMIDLERDGVFKIIQ